jgi:hypothetical protein
VVPVANRQTGAFFRPLKASSQLLAIFSHWEGPRGISAHSAVKNDRSRSLGTVTTTIHKSNYAYKSNPQMHPAAHIFMVGYSSPKCISVRQVLMCSVTIRWQILTSRCPKPFKWAKSASAILNLFIERTNQTGTSCSCSNLLRYGHFSASIWLSFRRCRQSPVDRNNPTFGSPRRLPVAKQSPARHTHAGCRARFPCRGRLPARSSDMRQPQNSGFACRHNPAPQL